MRKLFPKFPLQRLQEVQERPNDFYLLERIPSFQVPFQLIQQRCDDEKPIIFLDIETTGLSVSNDSIIELGILRSTYSPSMQRLTSIHNRFNSYEDPCKQIPEKITQLTGITNETVRGFKINVNELVKWFLDDPLIVAHNAAFDRPFFEKRFPELSNYKWACSCNEVDWKTLGFESSKLEYLLMCHGWFYERHRAKEDCYALAWLFHHSPKIFNNLWETSLQHTVLVRALHAPFEVKDQLKERGYRWHSGDSNYLKHWWCEINEDKLSEEKGYLNNLYQNSSQDAKYELRDARSRFKDGF